MDPIVGRLFGGVSYFGGVQESLGWNATAVETGATKLVTLDQGDREA